MCHALSPVRTLLRVFHMCSSHDYVQHLRDHAQRLVAKVFSRYLLRLARLQVIHSKKCIPGMREIMVLRSWNKIVPICGIRYWSGLLMSFPSRTAGTLLAVNIYCVCSDIIPNTSSLEPLFAAIACPTNTTTHPPHRTPSSTPRIASALSRRQPSPLSSADRVYLPIRHARSAPRTLVNMGMAIFPLGIWNSVALMAPYT